MQTSTNGSVSLFARSYAWGEAFVLIPLHVFWVLYKSSPFVAENTSSASVAVVPLGVMVGVGLAMRWRRVRAAVVAGEWLLHLTAAACMAVLLVWVALRDPFNPMLPISWPLCFWSVAVTFMLLSDLALHERMRGLEWAAAGWVRTLGVGVGLWVALVWLAVGMAWTPYFLTAAVVFHAMMAVNAGRARGVEGVRVIVRADLLRRATALVEAFFAVALMLTALLRFMFICNMTGTNELKYFQFVDICVNPWFAVGAALAVLGYKLRFAFLSHALAVGLLLLGGDGALWPISLAMGYGLPVLYCASVGEGALAYAVSVAAAMGVWVLGAFCFMMASLVIFYKMGVELAGGFLTTASVLVIVLFVAWLALVAVGRRRPKGERAESERTEDEVGEIAVSSKAGGLAYAAFWAAVLVPIVCIVLTTMWPPVWFRRSAQVMVERPAGVCHAGYSRSDAEYETLDKLGVDMMRIDFHWSKIQPGPETWNVGHFDKYLDEAEKHDVKVLALLAFDNNKAERSTTGSQRDHYIAPQDVPLFLEYVRRTVGHYKDRVYAWEIWNEPDIARFWDGPTDEFYELARRTAETVREVHPQARILGSAMTSALGAYSASGIEGLHTTGALDKVDHPTMHLYISDPRGYYNDFLRVRNAAAKHGHEGSVWITELGDPDGGVYPWRASSGLLAEHVIKSYTISTSLEIEKLIWYCYRDSAAASKQKNSDDSEGFFGLLGPKGQWKPAAWAYSLFAKNCSESVIRDDLVELSGGIAARQLRTALYRRGDGQSTLIMWFEPGLRPGAHARVTLDLGPLSEPAVMHDIASDYKKLLLDKVVDVTEKPLFITYQTPDVETPVVMRADSSPADAMWLAAVVGMVLWAGWGSVCRMGTDA